MFLKTEMKKRKWICYYNCIKTLVGMIKMQK